MVGGVNPPPPGGKGKNNMAATSLTPHLSFNGACADAFNFYKSVFGGEFAAFFHYDGQGAQGYEVFELQPTPAHLGGLPETLGESDAPVFSPDGRWLVMFSREHTAMVRGTDTSFEEVWDPEDDTPVLVDWAELFVQKLPGADIDRVRVGVEIPRSRDYEQEVSQWATYEAVRFDSADVVTLVMPWGEELRVPLPATGAVTSHGYTGG